ncbi:Uncharacterised protein [Weissella viridescens]|uniref:Uncharacterized protein n=1 Tax=Weissella viridescens TaxID=1629 RepID=A0A380P168_WEIVI|nr:Uncharacterised protein [Weissella viridescens]
MDINLLFSIDENFTTQLMTTVYSIYANSNKDNHYHVYIVQESPLKTADQLQTFFDQYDMDYHPIVIDKHDFQKHQCQNAIQNQFTLDY